MQEHNKRTIVSKVMVIAFALCMIIPAGAMLSALPAKGVDVAEQASASPNMSTKIYLKYGTFDTQTGEPNVQTNLVQQPLKAYEEGGFIIQANEPITEEWKAELQQNGVEIISYIPDNAFLVRVKGKDVSSIQNLANVGWMGEYHPAYKISPTVNENQEKVDVSIHHYIDGNNGKTVRLLRDNGARNIDVTASDQVNVVRTTIDASLISSIASLHDVEWIDVVTKNVKRNDATTQLCQSGSTTGGRPIYDAGIIGEGYIACVCDSGIRTTHEIFDEAGKIVENYVQPGSTDGTLGFDEDAEHGMHVSGTVLGDAYGDLTYNQYDGHAMGAHLIFQDIGNEDPTAVFPSGDYYNDHYQLAKYGDATYSGGAILHTNSWGGGYEYTKEAASIDRFIWDNREFTVLFAAGNDGAAETIGSQAENKNGICVASTRSDGTAISSFSSMGPGMPDGRIKPDLATPGEAIDSANCATDTAYGSMQGTSMATPGVAGDVVLVHEYFEKGYYPTGEAIPANGFEPSTALKKATMMAGAVDVGTADIPNFEEGWGRVHLDNSLYFAGDAKELKVIENSFGLMSGQSITYNFGVDDAQDLNIIMAYSDYPGNPSASKMLVNDLDMSVQIPGGDTYYNNNYANGYSQIGVHDDDLNNVRGVKIANPPTGVYSITIDAETVPYGPQPFAIAITGGLDAGYGTLTLNKGIYNVSESVEMTIEDLNNAYSMQTVTISGDISGDEETVTLTATDTLSGVFKGSIQTDMNNVVLNDGTLQVADRETITITYDDVDPAHTATATALIDASGPAISDVYVKTAAATSALITWKTDINANSVIYYRQVGDTVWQTAEDLNTYSLNHELALKGLTDGTLYEFDVASSKTTGITSLDTNGGHHYQFTTLSAALGTMVLLVDDDIGETSPLTGDPYEVDWMNNLDAYGWSYTHWDLLEMGTPTLADMNAAKMVIWTVQEGYPQIAAEDRATLGTYLDQTSKVPRLALSGQDIGWDMCDPAGTDVDVAWYQNYLKATFLGDDADGGAGSEGNTAFQVLNVSHPINYPHDLENIDLEVDCFDPQDRNDRFWPDDISNNGGEIAYDYNRHSYGGDAASIAFGGSYRMVYHAWSVDMISSTDDGAADYNPPAIDEDRSKMVDQTVIYLLGGDHPDIELTAPLGGETLSGSTTITWNEGGNPDFVNILISDDGGASWTEEANISAGIGSYTWDTSLLQDGTKYQVQVLGITVLADMVLTGKDTSGNLTLNNNVDNEGPALVPGSLSVSPNPTYGTSGTIEADFNDENFGNSGITQAEYFIDSTGADGTGTAMTAVSGLNTPQASFTATEPAPGGEGEHIIYAHALDDMGNWGNLEQISWFQYTTGATTPPVANAGPDQFGYTPFTCTFDGSGTEELDGDAVNYTWTFTYDGNPQTLYGVSPTFTFSLLGNYEVTLTASDVDGSTTDTVTISVADAIPPASPTGLTVEWYGISSTTDVATSNTISFGSQTGTYADTHTQDNVYNKLTEAVNGGPPQNPKQDLDAYYTIVLDGTGASPYTLYIDSYVSGDDTIAISYQVNGGGYTNLGTLTQTSDTDTYDSFTLTANPGDTVDVRIEDSILTNGEAVDNVYVDHLYIQSDNSGGGTDDNFVNFTASGDDGAGVDDVSHYNIYRSDVDTGPWDATTLYDTVTADGSATYTYIDSGAGEFDGVNWYYVVRAEDIWNNEDSNTIAVPEVSGPGTPPTADAGTDQTGYVDYLATFDGSATSEPDGDPVTYQWDFTYNGNPQSLTGVSPTFNFQIPGDYEVTLTATDTDGSDTDTMWVNVTYMTHNIAYTAGQWKMVSYAVDTPTDAIADVFAEEWGNVAELMYYDNVAKEWQMYKRDQPSWLNNLANVDHGMGVWALLDGGDGTIAIDGKVLTSTNIQLYAGWNLVGFPASAGEQAGTVLATTNYDGLQKFDSGSAYDIIDMGDVENMLPGNAYWVHVPADTSYTVTY